MNYFFEQGSYRKYRLLHRYNKRGSGALVLSMLALCSLYFARFEGQASAKDRTILPHEKNV